MPNMRWFTYERCVEPVHRLAAFEVVDGSPAVRLKASYTALPKVRPDLSLDSSSAIGLFLTASEVSEADNERLERCLADLLMITIQPNLTDHGSVLLVEGPPLSKLIGRIGYRYPRPDVTIAFVTIRPEYLPQLAEPSNVADEWDGPFPRLLDDSLLRTYFRYIPIPIRLDIFAQGLNRFQALDEIKGVPVGVTAKLKAISADVLEFAQYLAHRDEPIIDTAGDAVALTGLSDKRAPVLLPTTSPDRPTIRRGLSLWLSAQADVLDPHVKRDFNRNIRDIVGFIMEDIAEPMRPAVLIDIRERLDNESRKVFNNIRADGVVAFLRRMWRTDR